MQAVDRIALRALFILAAICVLVVSVRKPYHNWDMIMYMAAAKSFEERDVTRLQTFTYNELRNTVSVDRFNALTEGLYGQVVRTDPSAFAEQLPFYQIRPVYNGAVYVFHKAGLSIGRATHVVSAVAVVAALGLLYLMSVSFLWRPLAYAVVPLAFIFGMLDLARFSTPDAMAFLGVVLSAYLHMKGRMTLLLILLPVTIGIRTDLILFALPLQALLLVLRRTGRWKVVFSTAMTLVVYLAIGAYWRNPGWSTIFYFALVEILTHPISAAPVLTVSHYLRALSDGMRQALHSEILWLYTTVLAYSVFVLIRRAGRDSLAGVLRSPVTALSVACAVFVGGHFLAFPVLWPRFFTGAYLVGAFSLLVLVSEYRAQTDRVPSASPPTGDCLAR